MKTPMKEMFDQLKTSRKDEYGLAFAIDMLLENEQEMLEKEKEALSIAFHTDRPLLYDYENGTWFEEWYNETFNTKEK